MCLRHNVAHDIVCYHSQFWDIEQHAHRSYSAMECLEFVPHRILNPSSSSTPYPIERMDPLASSLPTLTHAGHRGSHPPFLSAKAPTRIEIPSVSDQQRRPSLITPPLSPVRGDRKPSYSVHHAMEVDRPLQPLQARVTQAAEHSAHSESSGDDNQLRLSDFQVVDTLGVSSLLF